MSPDTLPVLRPMSRRHMLREASLGFGSIALTALLAEKGWAGSTGTIRDAVNPSHHRPKARNVIFLYMDGGVSHVDSFDPKPRLRRENGQRFAMKMEPTQFEDNGAVLGNLWDFKKYGQSGLPVSDLFPFIGGRADDLCVIRSMVSNFSEHNAANYFLHCGGGMAGRPSMGAWATYGLGSENRDLPGYVVLDGGLIPSGGVDCFAAGFLPANFQASLLRNQSPALANVQPMEAHARWQQNKLAALRTLDAGTLADLGHPDALEASIHNAELAYRMQDSVPEVMDISREPQRVLEAYGAKPGQSSLANNCLLARRLVEQGVRFVHLFDWGWDFHGTSPSEDIRDGLTQKGATFDKPAAALIEDLEQRGLLDDTLILCTGEFGRTPFREGRTASSSVLGRDHYPDCYSVWMAGGGVKGGLSYGQSDELGFKAASDQVHIHDLQATILHLLGFDHTKLTYRFQGRDFRLTDVHGHVMKALIS